MLTICMVTSLFPRYRGDMQGISVALLVDGLVERGQSVSVLTASKVVSYKHMNKVSIYRLPVIPDGAGRSMLTGLYGFCKAPHLHSSVDVIHYHWASLSPNFSTMIANGPMGEKRPSIMTVRGGGLRSGLQNAIRYSLIKTMLNKVDQVVAVSQGMYDIARMYNVSPKKLTIIPNGVDTALFNPNADGLSVRKNFDIGDCPLVVSVGFEKIKGMEHVIKSIPKVLNEISDVKFILIGTDEKRKIELQTLARRLKVERAVFFVCPAPYHIMPNFFAAADVVATLFSRMIHKGISILPNEFGRVHLEAMACGTPVITSVGKGLIDNGWTGFRVSTDSDDIASTIVRIVQDKKLGKRLGKNARKLIMKYYSVEAMTERYLQLYKEVINQ